MRHRRARDPDAPEHPHMAARGTFVDVGGHCQPGPAPRFTRTPRRRVPRSTTRTPRSSAGGRRAGARAAAGPGALL